MATEKRKISVSAISFDIEIVKNQHNDKPVCPCYTATRQEAKVQEVYNESCNKSQL